MTTTTTLPDLPWHFSRNYQTVNNGAPVWTLVIIFVLLALVLVLVILLNRATSAK